MAWPTLTVAIAFGDGPLTALASNTWTDITAYVLSVDYQRGRQSELGRVEAGTATLLLDNSDRRFDPSYASSPYYPDVVPICKVRIAAEWNAISYPLWTGFVESWPPDWPGGLDGTTRIQCVDAFKFFASTRLNGAYSNEYCNWSIDTWLTAIGWPAADRSLASAQSQIQAGTFVNTPALQHFQNVVDVESGVFFMDGNGKAIFQNRHYRLVNSRSSLATFGDGHAQFPAVGGELPYLSVTSSYDDTNIWNEARITRTGGTEQVASDTASQAAYFIRTYTKTLPLYTDTEALALAQWIVGVYAEPYPRFTSITLDGGSDDSLWPHLFGRTLSERITVTQRPPGGAGSITQECYIESARGHIDHEVWQVTWGLSPAEALTYWVLQDSVYGELDVTTRLAY